MIDFFDMTLSFTASIEDAVIKMTANKKGILLICSDEFHLEGVITDGDLRRAMQKQTVIKSGVKDIMNIDPVSAETVAEAQELIKKYSVIAVPVVNNENKILKIVLKEPNTVIERENVISNDAYEDVNTIAIIPARGGSKRIPNKNLAELGGKSLVELAINCAQKCNRIGEIIVSTDSEKIASVARKAGVDVPWLRPGNLAKDNTNSLDVILHALKWVHETYKDKYKYVLLLEPTAPLRKVNYLYDVINILQENNCDCVASVSELPHTFNPSEQVKIAKGNLRPFEEGVDMNNRALRGEQEPTYVMNGLVYGMPIETVLRNKTIFGSICMPYITSWETYLDIDTPVDLKWAHLRMGG